MNLSELRDELRGRVSHNRSIEDIIKSDRFERLWEISTDKQQELVSTAALFGYKSRVKEWMKNHDSLQLGEQSLGHLKDTARTLKIANYCRMSKDKLILAIEKRSNK